MFFYFVVRPLQQPQQSLVRYLPVDLVPLAERTTSPQQQLRAPAPHEALTRPARDVPASPRPPVSLSPSRKQPPPDALETRVKQLAKLRQPDSAVPHLDNGSSDETPTTNDAPAGDMAGYRVSDFLRAQVERRWSLDLKRARNTVVLIRVKVAADGTVTNVEIVDRARYANDAAWRAVALSARNAMLLSSPLNLPSNYSSGPIDVTLALNSRDVMR
jgi:outer membrane biosynthesis protein TonB